MPGLSSPAWPGSLRESRHRHCDGPNSSSSLSDAPALRAEFPATNLSVGINLHIHSIDTMSTTDRDLTKAYSRAEFVGKLRRLADSIEAGKSFTIQVAGERLRIPADARFNVEHERSGSEEELEFQLLWTRR